MVSEFFSLLLIPLFFAGFDNSWQNTFCEIQIFGLSDLLQCDQIKDRLILKEGNNISMELDNSTDTITINALTGDSPIENYCEPDFIQNYNETTKMFECASVPSSSGGENNTASNVGNGFGLFKQKNGVILEFLNIFCAGDLLCSNNSTDVRISATIPTSLVYENNTVTDVGFGENIILPKVGIDIPIKGLAVSGDLTISSNATDITIGHTSTGSSSPRGGYLVGTWSQSQTKSNIGTSFVNVYTQTNSNGKAILIDTDTFTEVRLQIQWNKVGGGTQNCQVINGGTVLVSLTVISGSNDSGFVSIPGALLNAENEFRLQCKSTTSTDDPIFEFAAIWLR